MPTLANYGSAIASTTIALEQLIELATPQVTTRTLDAARVGLGGASVNLFLYRDELVSYRDGNDPGGIAHILAELHYLVSAHPGDEADANLLSQRAYGAARAAIERNPILFVTVGSNGSMQVRLTTTSLTIDDVTSLWIASTAPLRLSFGVKATFALTADDPASILGTIGEVVTKASAGLFVVFSGADAAAKAVAAATVAEDLGQSVVRLGLDEIVSKYIGETEKNLATLFARAEHKEFVLFLDEADALFGQRPEVPDGHDRYAGVEVGPILELLARAPGVVIVGLRDATGAELGSRTSVEVLF
jgi:hypothetical protein